MMVIGSPTRLRQIMVNLFSNAIKYNKIGGTIDTYTEEISFDGTTAWFEFKIKDSGIGMSEKFVRKNCLIFLLRSRRMHEHIIKEAVWVCPLSDS